MKSYPVKLQLLILPAFLMSISTVSFADAITGTSSVSATFTSTIEAGTCNLQVKNGAGVATSVVEFGAVFKSDLENKSRTENFSLAFSQCSGVTTAVVGTEISGGCSGPSSDGDSFPNSGGTAAATAVEIWKNSPDSGTQFSCINRATTQNIGIASASVDVPMTARMVVANGRTIADVTAGSFISPITFVVTYQ